MKNRKCIVCGELIAGRADKKYCSDQCRSIKNNGKKYRNQRPIIEVNRILRKNRTILKSLCPAGKATVRREVLEAMGYDFTVFSSLHLTLKRQLYYLCYDFGFTPITDKGVKKALIITKQDYMKEWDPWRYVEKKNT